MPLPLGYKHSDLTKKKIGDALRGRKLSEEHKRNCGLSHAGLKCSEETKKKMSKGKLGNKFGLGNKSRLGMTTSEETRKKMSDALKGENHYNWKGGITPINNKIRYSIEYKLWQDSVFARDGYTCQKCHQIIMPYKLVGHHILNFSNHIELRMAIDNGITFCRPCHKIFHKIYGVKNNTREQVDEFLSNL